MANRKPTIRELDSAYIKQREQEKQLQLKRKRGLMRRLTVLGFVGFIILGIVSATLITQAKSIGEKKEEQATLQEEHDALIAEQEKLEQDIQNYNNPDYIGEVLRRDYFLTRPGETLYKLPESSSD
ncbi:FtsB family cell division protein [Alkalicoccobacillus gibsonii]|jgi:cell division protein DivIC|uniref:Septum formation initiator family protein n=1 Tax=Alkalicoccobacillus gibsonii TaxID=79881 RepID=A0ABU9VCN7_9BACI|nr:septum formation initiator family protein [Alkalicoccobacillus gibsonii]MBM0067765.1 septum formation initiator family protein [Alkalicoccobacillus gibsonii]